MKNHSSVVYLVRNFQKIQNWRFTWEHTQEKKNISLWNLLDKFFIKWNSKKTHTGEKPFTYVCDSKFSFHASLKIHLRTHTGEKPFHCKICEAKFSDSSNFRKHLQIHSGQKFVIHSFLQVHEEHAWTHTWEKPFSCEICGAKFTQNSSLHRHMQRHITEKKYFLVTFVHQTFQVIQIWEGICVR